MRREKQLCCVRPLRHYSEGYHDEVTKNRHPLLAPTTHAAAQDTLAPGFRKSTYVCHNNFEVHWRPVALVSTVKVWAILGVLSGHPRIRDFWRRFHRPTKYS